MRNDAKKTQALNALMECGTLTEAAEKAGISRKTLYNYMTEDKAFIKAYRSAKEQVILETMEETAKIRADAQRVIVDLMRDTAQPAAIRLKAATAALGLADSARAAGKDVIQTNINRQFNPFDD